MSDPVTTESRFVFLRHEFPDESDRESHYDLMFELDGKLLTWTCRTLPQDVTLDLMAKRIDDHRLDYLEYEGEISENRGTVKQVDKGTCAVVSVNDFECSFAIEGESCKGTLEFNIDSPQFQRWRMSFEPEPEGH